MINVKAKVYSFGKMAGNIMESGRMASNMEEVNSLIKWALKKRENGGMGRKSSGSHDDKEVIHVLFQKTLILIIRFCF